MSFHVGQKVVCVDAYGTHQLRHIKELSRGAIYTIRWAGILNEKYCVKLEEIAVRHILYADGSKTGDYDDHPFRAARFRPLIERKTDISIFTRMLTPNELERT